MAEIKISWKAIPPGQVGPRPQKIKLSETHLFTCADPGTLTIEFIKDSPLDKDNKRMTIGKDVDFIAQKEGRFKFKCKLTAPDGTTRTLGDANEAAGGEIEIGT